MVRNIGLQQVQQLQKGATAVSNVMFGLGWGHILLHRAEEHTVVAACSQIHAQVQDTAWESACPVLEAACAPSSLLHAGVTALASPAGTPQYCSSPAQAQAHMLPAQSQPPPSRVSRLQPLPHHHQVRPGAA